MEAKVRLKSKGHGRSGAKWKVVQPVHLPRETELSWLHLSGVKSDVGPRGATTPGSRVLKLQSSRGKGNQDFAQLTLAPYKADMCNDIIHATYTSGTV